MQEIRVRLEDKVLKNYTSEKGEVLQVVKKGRAKKVWDQMLERGRCTQEQYDDANIDGTDFKWPFGEQEKKEFALFVIDDEITDSEADAMELPVKDNDENIIKRSDYKIDLDNVPGISGDTLAKIKDKNQKVEIKYNKKKSKSIITKKA